MYKITNQVGDFSIIYEHETIEGVIALTKAADGVLAQPDYTNPESPDAIYTKDFHPHRTTGVVGEDEPDL